MLTFVVATDTEEMADVGWILVQAREKMPPPDVLLIADLFNGDSPVLRHLKRHGNEYREEKLSGKKHKTKNGLVIREEAVFILSQNCNLLGDVFLRRLFKGSRPQSGYRFRLVKLINFSNRPEMVELKTLEEKYSAN